MAAIQPWLLGRGRQGSDYRKVAARHRFVSGVIACVIASAAVFGCTPAAPALQLVPASLPDAKVGTPYAATIAVTKNVTPVGGASIQEGSLPAGLTLEKIPGEDGVQISGTPTAAGKFEFSIFVWCYGTNVSGQTLTQAFTLVVSG
jgi:Putative Ig domain